MRILHVTYSLAADQGGPTMVTTRVAAAQAGLGHDVTILTRESAGKETELPPIEGSKRVRVERLARRGGGALGKVLGTIAKVRGSDSKDKLRELIARHDVVHVHNIWDPILIHTVNEARAQKKPVVLSPHGILTRWALSEKRLKKSIAMRLLYRRAIEKVSVVHALSSFEREEMAAFGFGGKVVVVPNGVFLEEIDPLPAAGAFYAAHPEIFGRQAVGREEHGGNAKEREPFVLFLSRLHPIKGLDILVDAFAKVLKKTTAENKGKTPSVIAVAMTPPPLGKGEDEGGSRVAQHQSSSAAEKGIDPSPALAPIGEGVSELPRLVIIGPDFGMEAPIREQASRLNIADRVHLTGPIFGRGKYDAMVDCACFCLPSGHEAFSVAIAEAMACRACVVISPECHLPEAEQAGAGLVVERDAAKLAEALEQILASEQRRRVMGQAGRKLVEDHFTWEKVAESLVAAYRTA